MKSVRSLLAKVPTKASAGIAGLDELTGAGATGPHDAAGDINGQSRFAQAAAPGTPIIGNTVWRSLTSCVGMNIAIAAFCLTLIGTIWGAVMAQVRHDRQETIDNAIKQNSNLALALEEQTIRTIKGVDAAALFVAHEYARLGTQIDLTRYIEGGFIDSKLFANLGVVDERGDMLVSSQSRSGPVNVADRDYFRVHMQQDSGKLYFSKPVVSRITGNWTFPMTRRINKPDGSFGGIVSMAVDPGYFISFYRRTDLGKLGLINLVGLDGISLARLSGQVASFGQNMSESDLLGEQAKSRIGNFLSTGRSEGIARYESFRTIPGYPLVIAVGTSREEVLAGFLESRNHDYWAALLFTAVIGLFGVSLIAALARQKRVSAALAGSEAQFRATFEQAAVGIIHTTLDRRFRLVNQTFCDMLGYTHDELLAMQLDQIAHPDEREAGPDFKRALAGEINTYSGEKRYIRKDGSVLWVNRTVSLARDSAGKPLYFIRVVEDISERNEAEDRFLATFEQAAVGIAHIAPDNFHIHMANHKFCELLGYTQDELIGTDSRARTPPGGMPEREAERAQVLAGKIKTSTCERQLLRKDGSLLWVNRSLSLVRDPAGKPKYYISVIEDISERKQAQEGLAYLAQYDSLTGLPNRNLFRDRLTLAIARAKRDDQRVALMFLDLDRFKEINDSLGHTAGDEVLQAAAGLLRESLRDADTIARLGGDEFTIILENAAQLDHVTAVAEKIKKAFSDPFMIHGREFFVTASIGISFYPHDANDSEALLKTADIAMYQAKKAGRNAYGFYAPELNAQAGECLKIEALLRRALECQEFVLHYQPKVEMATGKIVGVEALIRWNSRELGLVPPVRFIPLAEETGLIEAIGEWVMKTACAQNKAWQDQGYPPLLMSVNLSSRQLRQKNLVEMVAGVLNDTGLSPAFLELEITESLIMENIQANIETLKAIRRLGVSLAIDDFGTGYSSLAYLAKLPVQTLKIDRSFVAEMQKDSESLTLVSTILTMARSLNLKVIAEGVETAYQEKLLRLLRCDEMQGYLISRPLPAPDLASFVRKAELRAAV